MSYTWFRVDSSVVDHPKVLDLASRLKDPNAGWFVIRLWAWTQRYATTGKFPKDRVDQLEAACRWSGKPGFLFKTFVEVGLVADAKKTAEVHDWDEFQGKLVEKSSRDADVKRKKRAADRDAKERAARAGRDPGTRTLPTDVTRPTDVGSMSPTPPEFRSDQAPPPSNGGQKDWGSVAEKLAVWMRAQRSLAGNFPDDRETDVTAIEAWTLAWCLKHEPDDRAYDQMCAAFNGYLVDDWAIARKCTLSLWCADNVGLHRWTAERAKEAA